HRRQAERVDAVAREREADETARLLDHEVDHLRRHELRRADQVPFILAILVVRDDDELPIANVGDRLLYRSEDHVLSLSNRWTYLPSMSASTCTPSPTASSPSVVCRSVYSINEICSVSGMGRSLTVRLTPSMVTEPCCTISSAS